MTNRTKAKIYSYLTMALCPLLLLCSINAFSATCVVLDTSYSATVSSGENVGLPVLKYWHNGQSLKTCSGYIKMSSFEYQSYLVKSKATTSTGQCLPVQGTASSNTYLVDKPGLDLMTCNDEVLLPLSEFGRLSAMSDVNNVSFEEQAIPITPFEIAESFTWGFGTYIFFWWLGYVIKSARLVIKKA